MNSELIDQVSGNFGANGLPYVFPIHPNLVHLTLGLFIVGIGFDIVGALFLIEKPVFKFFALPATRAGLFDVGWYNTLASAIITFFTVATGFYEIMLAQPPADIKSAWGLGAETTMLWHGVGGVLLLVLIVGMTVWRGFQRFVWRKDVERQVHSAYLACGMVILFIMFVHGTLGAHLAGDFGVHNTAARLLRMGQDPDSILK